jgi:flagella basal body P-ring formation protein FlgA
MSLISGTTNPCKTGQPVSFIVRHLFVGTLSVLFSVFISPTHAAARISLEEQVFSALQRHYGTLFPKADITIDINSINAGINQRKCQNLSIPLEPKIPSGGRLSLRVSCNDPTTWHTYVLAKVAINLPVAFAKRTIPRGTSISSADLIFHKADVTELNRGFFKDPAEVLGYVARRTISDKSILTPSTLEAPMLIQKGHSVMIEAGRGALTIRTQGIALEDGAKGEQISVMNSRSQKVIKAYVLGRGRVTTQP